MSRIGENLPPRILRTTEEDPSSRQPDAGAPLASTAVEPGETSLAQVAERLELLLSLLTQLNPQLAKLPRLETGQTVFYPQIADSAPEVSSSASRRTEAMFDAMQHRNLVNQEPVGSGGTIPPYDPKTGPQITNDMWTEEMLTGELTEEQLRNIVDPAAFLNARIERRQKPTEAVWVSTISGARQSVNPSQMSTPGDAEAMLQRLRALGYSGGGVTEQRPENPFSRIEYGSDPRRHLNIGEFNVGLLLERYAKYPKEQADQMTLTEIAQAGAAS